MLRTVLITVAVLAVGYFLGSKYPGLLSKVGL
jgi:hypothetical protein